MQRCWQREVSSKRLLFISSWERVSCWDVVSSFHESKSISCRDTGVILHQYEKHEHPLRGCLLATQKEEKKESGDRRKQKDLVFALSNTRNNIFLLCFPVPHPIFSVTQQRTASSGCSIFTFFSSFTIVKRIRLMFTKRLDSECSCSYSSVQMALRESDDPTLKSGNSVRTSENKHYSKYLFLLVALCLRTIRQRRIDGGEVRG